ncbi:hypothetical protein V8E36_004111 [Tilletia maclaganii]
MVALAAVPTKKSTLLSLPSPTLSSFLPLDVTRPCTSKREPQTFCCHISSFSGCLFGVECQTPRKEKTVGRVARAAHQLARFQPFQVTSSLKQREKLRTEVSAVPTVDLGLPGPTSTRILLLNGIASHNTIAPHSPPAELFVVRRAITASSVLPLTHLPLTCALFCDDQVTLFPHLPLFANERTEPPRPHGSKVRKPCRDIIAAAVALLPAGDVEEPGPDRLILWPCCCSASSLRHTLDGVALRATSFERLAILSPQPGSPGRPPPTLPSSGPPQHLEHQQR